MYLLRLQIIIAALLLFCLNGYGQREQHRAHHDDLSYYFGMSVAYNYSYLHATKHVTFINNDSIASVNPSGSGGVALGLHATAKLTERLQVRFHPQLIIGGSKLFTYVLKYPQPGEKTVEEKKLPSTIVSLPIQFKFNSDRIHNFRVYMMGGLKYDIDLASNSNARNAENLVKLKQSDFGVDVGIGFNIFMAFVTVSPEIKFSTGLTNIHARDPKLKYSNVLDKLQSRMITLSLILED